MRLAFTVDADRAQPPPYRQPVYPVVTCEVVKPFRCRVDGECRRVEPGELVELIEPDFYSMAALGRVRPAT